MDTVIYSFVKKHSASALKRNPALHTNNPVVGVILASKRSDNTVGIGWSRCAVNRGDNFNKERGLQIALGRAEHGAVDCPPSSMFKVIEAMEARAAKYFKGSEVRSLNTAL